MFNVNYDIDPIEGLASQTTELEWMCNVEERKRLWVVIVDHSGSCKLCCALTSAYSSACLEQTLKIMILSWWKAQKSKAVHKHLSVFR